MAAALGMLKAAPDTKFDFKGFANNIGWLLIDVGRPDTAAAADKEDAAAWRGLRHLCQRRHRGFGLCRQRQRTRPEEITISSNSSVVGISEPFHEL